MTDPTSESSPFPPYLSPSQINTLLTCGEQFRLQRVARVPSRPMVAGVGGRCVHQITEELDRQRFAETHPDLVGAE